ncbi:MAG: hypothetical protein AAGG68_26970 [Bacteroidota bacterium]
MKYWLGFDDLSDRFGVFGSSPDGSLYSIWLDDDHNQKIVHLGSEGGELYILSNTFVDFLRLLAIGYDEIGFADMSKTAEEWSAAIDMDIDECININFRNWVKQKFNVDIPSKGEEITNIGDDTFSKWIESKIDKYSS